MSKTFNPQTVLVDCPNCKGTSKVNNAPFNYHIAPEKPIIWDACGYCDDGKIEKYKANRLADYLVGNFRLGVDISKLLEEE